MERNHKFYESDGFRNLQKNWYETLKDQGFRDCEKVVGRGRIVMAQTSTHPYRHHASQTSREAKLHYYLSLSSRLATEEFKLERDQIVMHLRADGAKIKEIVCELSLRGYRIHRQTVRFIIRRYETKWEIRQWRAEQLTSNRVTGSSVLNEQSCQLLTIR